LVAVYIQPTTPPEHEINLSVCGTIRVRGMNCIVGQPALVVAELIAKCTRLCLARHGCAYELPEFCHRIRFHQPYSAYIAAAHEINLPLEGAFALVLLIEKLHEDVIGLFSRHPSDREASRLDTV
jgi:hypothetical protein